MAEFELRYSLSFDAGVQKLLIGWSELGFSEDKIKSFLQSIDRATQRLAAFPEMHEEVSKIYNLSEPTRRLLIGKQYAIFYRVDYGQKIILVGSIFSQKQMKVQF